MMEHKCDYEYEKVIHINKPKSKLFLSFQPYDRVSPAEIELKMKGINGNSQEGNREGGS